MNNLSASQKEFYQRLKLILWERWDPIGVNDGDDEWDDEYDSYVPHIFRLAINGSDVEKIANSLSSSIKQNMGLEPNLAHDLEVAKLIVKSKKEIIG
ncbi:hypothetical protein [Zooshikella ganghwensis]|uniref:DUF1871 family protein n=1 Tax=Zooshikella ganghwensis TaxID=202772 RepID=A0A4P9VIH0_9GAMM|nr:hypothetical protein [Zooshikella ganghwensis]RDH41442.1 hypothetical protein B9G39_28715 [Zooshikella ganghwensis]